MKKTALALTLTLALLVSTMTGVKLVNLSIANPYPYTNCDSSFVTVSILSPENKTYDTNSILITVFAGAYPGIWGVGYSLDGGPMRELAPDKWDGHTFNQSVMLNRLSKGTHNIVAKAVAPASDRIIDAYSQVYFAIGKETEPPDITAPAITVFSPQNKTYYETGFLPINFSVNEPECLIRYKLDSQEPVEISNNNTLIYFYFGSHNLTLYATDTLGNIGSQTVIFTLARLEETSPTEPFPATLLFVASVGIALVVIGLLVYFKKPKS
jgi:hypothetical protein